MAYIHYKDVEYFKQLLFDHEGVFFERDEDNDYVILDRNRNVMSKTWSEEEMFEFLEEHCPEFYRIYEHDDRLNPVLFVCQP